MPGGQLKEIALPDHTKTCLPTIKEDVSSRLPRLSTTDGGRHSSTSAAESQEKPEAATMYMDEPVRLMITPAASGGRFAVDSLQVSENATKHPSEPAESIEVRILCMSPPNGLRLSRAAPFEWSQTQFYP